jgi:hypothetical protein
MSDGIRTLSAEMYFAAEGVSRSMLDDILPPENTPLHFWARHVGKTAVDEETDAQRMGALVHRFLLEEDTTRDAFHIKPAGMNFATKDGKAWKLEHSDLPIIDADEHAAIHSMRAAVWAHPVARRFLKGAKTEQCLFGTDDKGTLRKARLDILHETGDYLPDLKTCISASEKEISKAVDAFGYYRQAAYYLDLCALLGIEKKAFVLICVEKTPPFDVVCWQIADEIVDLGRREYQGALQLYRECLESNHWPGRSKSILGIGLPAWRERELNAA